VVVTVGVIVVGSTGSPTAMDLVRCEWAVVVVGTVGTPTDAAVSSMLLWIEVVMGSPIAMRLVRLAWIGREQSPPPRPTVVGAALSRERPEDGWVELADADVTCWVERNDNDDEVVPLPPPLIVVAPPALPPDIVYIVSTTQTDFHTLSFSLHTERRPRAPRMYTPVGAQTVCACVGREQSVRVCVGRAHNFGLGRRLLLCALNPS
jgi:hypothetical protein